MEHGRKASSSGRVTQSPWKGVRRGEHPQGPARHPCGEDSWAPERGLANHTPSDSLNGAQFSAQSLGAHALTGAWKASSHPAPSLGLPPPNGAVPLGKLISQSETFTSVTGGGWTNPVGLLPRYFFHYCVFFLLNEFLHGPQHGSQMKVELFSLKLGCLSGVSCSPGAAPKAPSFFRSQCEYHCIRLSSSPCQLRNYTPWWGSHRRGLCLCSSHPCDSAPRLRCAGKMSRDLCQWVSLVAAP